jgi:hypothetical protein
MFRWSRRWAKRLDWDHYFFTRLFGNMRKYRRRWVMCWVVVRYRPHRTKRGHYVWVRDGEEAGPLSPEQLKVSHHRYLPVTTLHNKRLTEREVMEVIAEGLNC